MMSQKNHGELARALLYYGEISESWFENSANVYANMICFKSFKLFLPLTYLSAN